MNLITPRGACGATCSCADVVSPGRGSLVPPLVRHATRPTAPRLHGTASAIDGPSAIRGKKVSTGPQSPRVSPRNEGLNPDPGGGRSRSSLGVGEFRAAVVNHFFDTARERLSFEPWCRAVLFVGEEWLRVARESLGTAPSSSGLLAPSILETVYDPTGLGVRVDFLSQSGVPLRSYLYCLVRRTAKGAQTGIVVRLPNQNTVGKDVEFVVCCWAEGQRQEDPSCVCNAFCDTFPTSVPCPERKCNLNCTLGRQPNHERASSLLGHWPGWTDPTPIQERMSGNSLWLS